jgi:uncharacterized protein YbdZ (MbtH family)
VKTGTGNIIDNPSQVGGWIVPNTGVPCADSDHDGMPDTWEQIYGFNPNNPDGSRDTDGDGYTNVEEYINGTNPLDSIPQTTDFVLVTRITPTSSGTAVSVNFTVTFSKSVTGVDVSDFRLTTSGISGATVSGVKGSGKIYIVTVNTGSGVGTLRLDVPVDASITDLAGNSLTGIPFTSGESFTINPFADMSLWTNDFSYYPQGWRADMHPRVMGDVNMDGKDDVIGFGYGGVLVALSNGAGFDPATNWTTDFSYNQGWRMDTYPRMVGDVNGDKMADVVGFGYAGAVVALSNGAGFEPLSLWTNDFSYPQGWRANMHPRVLGDVNKDGKDDIIGFGYGGILVALSNGTSFDPVTNWTGDFSYNQGWRMDTYPRMVGDVNGDGKDDVVGFGYSGVSVGIAK